MVCKGTVCRSLQQDIGTAPWLIGPPLNVNQESVYETSYETWPDKSRAGTVLAGYCAVPVAMAEDAAWVAVERQLNSRGPYPGSIAKGGIYD